MRSVRPNLYKGFNPWDRISEVEQLRALLNSAGLPDSEIVAVADFQPVNSPDDWWAMILGSGYRGTVDQLSSDEREQVRIDNFDFIQQNSVRSLESNVVYAVAVKN